MAPAYVMTVADTDGHVIRRLTGPAKAGFHRIAWDLRFPPPDPTSLEPWQGNAFSSPPIGPRVVPDTYRVSLAKRVDGVETPLAGPQEFSAVPLGTVTLPAADREAQAAFQAKTARLQRAVLGAASVVEETASRLSLAKKAVDDTAGADPELGTRVRELESRLHEIRDRLMGDRVRRRHQEPTRPSILRRVGGILAGWNVLAGATGTQQDAYEIAADAFEGVLGDLRRLVEDDLARLEGDLESAGAPWTPGRLPQWTRE